jgi:predicted enzyme related to lactoylglutathione lyase
VDREEGFMTEARFGLGRIGQIAVTVAELERAVSFYRDVLGMRFLFQVPRMAFFDAGGVRLMLAVPEREEFAHLSSVIYYDVSDLNGAYGTLQSRGAAFEGEPHLVADLGEKELWMAFLRDSEGNLLALMSEIHKVG